MVEYVLLTHDDQSMKRGLFMGGEIRARYAELMCIYDDGYVFPFSHFRVFREDGAVVEAGDVIYMSVRVGAFGDNVRWVGSDGTTWSDDGLTNRVFDSGERVSVLKEL